MHYRATGDNKHPILGSNHRWTFGRRCRTEGGNAPTAWRRSRREGWKIVTFRVLDAGDPVAGATIRVGGRTLRTNAAGAASVDLPGEVPGGRLEGRLCLRHGPRPLRLSISFGEGRALPGGKLTPE